MDSKKVIVSPAEGQRYPLPSPLDRDILAKIHQAEEIPDLGSSERFLLLLIRSQLEVPWREPLLQVLDTLLGNRGLSPDQRWQKILEEGFSTLWNPSEVRS
ncbi:MAG: hypothetical protein Q8P22_06170 [Chloroflexota bacterium]|nr:hypothetical protein [Chloroflexota bacterium]